MNCPICEHSESRTVRTDAAATEIRRRRECLQCRHRWTTVERTQEAIARADKIVETARPLAELVR
jgi:transcriptional regulator NrdR family protein